MCQLTSLELFVVKLFSRYEPVQSLVKEIIYFESENDLKFI